MEKIGIEKLKQAIEDGITVYNDIQEAKESGGKLTGLEAGFLVAKHSIKAVKFVSAIKDISAELIDLDGAEAAQLVDLFGGSEEAKEAITNIAMGAGYLNQGIQQLILLKK